MSSLPGGDSTGIVLRIPCNSSTRDAVCSSFALIFFADAFSKLGVPSGRVADAMEISGLPAGCVMVWTTLGVGGANPPRIPIETGQLFVRNSVHLI